MPVVSINRAEAILEPFWDPEISPLRRYRFKADPLTSGTVKQDWCWITFQWTRCPAGACPGEIVRTLDVDLRGYDRLVVQAGVPQSAGLVLEAAIDGQPLKVIDVERGNDDFAEYEGAIQGTRLTELRLRLRSERDEPAILHVNWIGLADSRTRSDIPHQKTGYSASWPGLLVPEGAELAFRPSLGLFFVERELEKLRRKAAAPPFSQIMDQLREEARKYLDARPEELIYEYIATGNARYARDRDKNRAAFSDAPPVLAFVGLMDRDAKLLRLASRFVMAAVHTDYWFESFMGQFPNSRWHHRSFYEEHYGTAVVLALDWAGGAFTDAGKHLTLDTLQEKALLQMERDFREMHYIRHCNQGLVFNRGRILTTLALLSRPTAEPPIGGPCPGQFIRQADYSELLDRAEKDQFEMVGNYVLPDGGTLEGGGYWSYTFATSLMGFAALARQRGRSVKSYVPESIRKTGHYALNMLSECGRPGTYVPVNDCHTGAFPSATAAFYGSLMGEPRWQEILLNAPPDGGISGIFALIWGSAALPRHRPKQFLFEVLPKTGQIAARSANRTLFHLVSGGCGNASHTHEDKGSFIVECNDEPVLIDRGMLNYSHPACHLLSVPERHNLLTPVPEEGERIFQLVYGDGGKITCARSVDQAFLVATDTTRAWPHHFKQCVRSVFSPRPDLWIVVDEVALSQARALAFHLQTLFAVERGEGWLKLAGQRSGALVQAIQRAPAAMSWAEDSLDEHAHPVTHVKLEYPKTRRARIVILLETSPEAAPQPWQTADGHGLVRGDERLTLEESADKLALRYFKANRATVSGQIAGRKPRWSLRQLRAARGS